MCAYLTGEGGYTSESATRKNKKMRNLEDIRPIPVEILRLSKNGARSIVKSFIKPKSLTLFRLLD